MIRNAGRRVSGGGIAYPANPTDKPCGPVPVLILCQFSRSMPIEKVDGVTLKGEVREHVDRSAKIMTDDWAAYVGLTRSLPVMT